RLRSAVRPHLSRPARRSGYFFSPQPVRMCASAHLRPPADPLVRTGGSPPCYPGALLISGLAGFGVRYEIPLAALETGRPPPLLRRVLNRLASWPACVLFSVRFSADFSLRARVLAGERPCGFASLRPHLRIRALAHI